MSKLKVILLYKGYIDINLVDEIYRNPLENALGSIQFDISRFKDCKSASDKREWASLAKDILGTYDYVLICDSDWFKVLTKNKKAETTLGMVQNSPNFNSKVFYCPSQYVYQIDPEKHQNQFQSVLGGIQKDLAGLSTIIEPEIHREYYPLEPSDIKKALDSLLDEPILFSDIEAKSLKVTEAGIYTTGFSKDKHNGIAFPVDASSNPQLVRQYLKEFFENYKGKLVFHKANYDIAVLNYNLFQKDLFDIGGQLYGLNTFFKDNRIEDTLIIAYLATNSCSGNILGLKELSQPYTGDYAVDVKDVTKVPLDKLLKYNLIDCLGTAYVYETYYPIMVQEEQETLYKEFMLPTLKTNIRCQLNGLPIDLNLVKKFKDDLNQEREQLLSNLLSSKVIENAQYAVAEKTTIKRNSKLKTKVTTVEDNLQPFNFHSGDQLRVLIYEIMQLPIINTTDSGMASTDGDTLKDLQNHTENQEYKNILQWIKELGDVDKISTAFIPNFEQALDNRLLGYINCGGTVSGRMSHSNPNLAQLPSTGSRFSKPTKKVFISTEQWLFVGIDFNSLESRIDALTTKDPEKLKVFLEGYDSHSINAYTYYTEQMPDIIPISVESINSIQTKYKDLRQASKQISFALQYGSTAKGLEVNAGLSPEDALKIYNRYHNLYKVSLEWKESKLRQAYIDGYITTGFGLRVRTNFLKGKQYKLDRKGLEGAEARTAGNALGQGWGVLNDRAMNEVMEQVDLLGLSNSILPINRIHDACYYLVRNDIDILLKLNELCVKAAYWNDHPDIYHPIVSLGGQLEIFYPDWSNPLTLPETCTEEQLLELVSKHKESLKDSYGST